MDWHLHAGAAIAERVLRPCRGKQDKATPLIVAASAGHSTCLRYVANAPGARVNDAMEVCEKGLCVLCVDVPRRCSHTWTRRQDGATALCIAAGLGDEECVRHLTLARADVNAAMKVSSAAPRREAMPTARQRLTRTC